LLLYLDLNCFNRPFDDQSYERIARETAAVFSILERIVEGTDQLAWSGVLDFESSQHPKADRRIEIGSWRDYAGVYVTIDEMVAERARELTAVGLTALDAAHVACAELAQCGSFLTCDDRLIRRALRAGSTIEIQNPNDYLKDQTNAGNTDG
jgi:predicted nucleic acid-binding protein